MASDSDSDEVTVVYDYVKPVAPRQNNAVALKTDGSPMHKKRDSYHLPGDDRPRKHARLESEPSLTLDDSAEESPPPPPRGSSSRAHSHSSLGDALLQHYQNGFRHTAGGHARSGSGSNSPFRFFQDDTQEGDAHISVPRPDQMPAGFGSLRNASTGSWPARDLSPDIVEQDLLPVKREPRSSEVPENNSAVLDLCTSDEEDVKPVLRQSSTSQAPPSVPRHVSERPAQYSATPEPLRQPSQDRKPAVIDLDEFSITPLPSARDRLPPKSTPKHLQSRRLPFLKRNLPPAITHRKWGGACRDVHIFLSHTERITPSTMKISNRPECQRGQYSASNPTIKYTFKKCCVDHAQIESAARMKSWLYSDACPWCSGTDANPTLSITNIPDLLAHHKRHHPRFAFTATRERSQRVVLLTVTCQHDSPARTSNTPQPRDSGVPAPASSATPTPAPQASLPAHTLDTEMALRVPAPDTEPQEADHQLVPYAQNLAIAPPPLPHLGISLRSPGPLSFMDLALSHAQKVKDWAPSALPPAAQAQGARYTPSVPAGWAGSKKDKKPIQQTYHQSTKKSYLRSLDFGQLNKFEDCSDSEDDDGDNYHWESRFQQMRLADKPDVDPNAVFMQQIWLNTCRTMADAHRSLPYEACLRLITSYTSAIRSRNARKELVEHLASMASLHTITPDQAEVLLQKYDRRSTEETQEAGRASTSQLVVRPRQ